MPHISILMPLYNGGEYLPSALRSIRWQTFADWELIIVDDGSTDGSREYVQEIAAHDPRITVLTGPHCGITAVLNRGLAHCKAPWVARMDSDDISSPRRLERQWCFVKDHPDLAAVGSFVRLFPQHQRTLGMRRYERWLNRYWRSDDLARDIFVESPLVHPSVLMRREAILAAGGYRDCPWPEDYDLWMRLWQRGERLAKVPEVLFFWRDTERRLTRTDARCSHASLRELKLHYLRDTFFPECQPIDEDINKAPMLANNGDTDLVLLEKRLNQRPTLVWGAGTNGKDLVKDLRKLGIFPSGLVDNHPSRRGQRILDIPVYGLDQVSLERGQFIIMAVSNPYTRAEVRQQLAELGAQEGRDFVCLANMAR